MEIIHASQLVNICGGYHSLLSIHAVLAGSDAHLAKASSSLIGGYSSLKTLE